MTLSGPKALFTQHGVKQIKTFLTHGPAPRPPAAVSRKKVILLSLALLLWLPHPALAAGISNLQQQGNAALETGDHTRALELFTAAVEKNPANADSLYNQGIALYRLGRYIEAAHAFAASEEADRQRQGRAEASYNLGRAKLAAAGGLQQQSEKKKLLLEAGQAFHQSLRLDPQLLAARKGIADFRRAYSSIPPAETAREQQEGHPDPEKQEPGRKDLNEQLRKAEHQQQALADQSTSAASAQAEQDGTAPTSMENLRAAQQNTRQALEQLKEELTPGQQDLTQALEDAIDTQQQAEQALDNGDFSQAGQHQQQAADQLRRMVADLAPEETGHNTAPPVHPGETAEVDGTHHTPDQDSTTSPSPLIDDILDNEKALHEMRRLRMQLQRPAGGKDW